MEIADLFDIVFERAATESVSAAGPAVMGLLWPTMEPIFEAIRVRKLQAPGRRTAELFEKWRSESEENAQQLAVARKIVGSLTLLDFVALQLQESKTKLPRTGLKKLKELGVPDTALAALLAVLAPLTLTPYLVGRDLGPVTIQAFLPPAVHWLLAMGLPLIWFLLIASDPLARPRGSKLAIISILAPCVIALAILTQPRERVLTLEQAVEPGSESSALSFEVTYPQKVIVSVMDVQPAVGLSMNICGTETGQTKCVRDQYGVGTKVARALQAGNVQLSAFNFGSNPRALIKVSASFWERIL